MTKKLVFTSEESPLTEAHVAGGCLLPTKMAWPTDAQGIAQLHLFTFPLSWLSDKSTGWISVFTPYSLSDTYAHWEELTIESGNQSQAIIHDNDGPPRNEYQRELSTAKRVFVMEDNQTDSDKNFESKIFGVPAWLQDRDSLADHQCVLSVSGEDIDIGFPEEPGIFSDGMIYLFLRNGFGSSTTPSAQGLISFQFT